MTKSTSSDFINILNARRLPGRISIEQAAHLLGVQVHDIPTLVAAKLLEHLGNPTPSAIKYFHVTDVTEKAANPKWQHKATNCIYRHWHVANARRRKNQPSITPEKKEIAP